MQKGIAGRAAGIALAVVVGAFGQPGVAGTAATRLQAIERGANTSITLTPIDTGLERPVYLTHAGDDSGRLFVVEKEGRIRVYQNGQAPGSVFLDISSRVEDDGNEQGLLSVAFHPDYASNGRFFVYYTTRGVGGLADGSLTIAEYHVSANPNVAETTERLLLNIPHPGQANHNGGLLKFGPDGFLYAGVGDGGGAGDPGEPPGNGQNTNVLLGKILRIDVDSGDPYGIPPNNPFAGGTGGRREIYAYGFRNPWRWSFDRQNGNLWVGDVGQNQFEEVDIVERGGNYGWVVMEGFHCFDPPSGCSMTGLRLPIFEYSHGGSNGVESGCSITGGSVYRGAAIPALVGTYLFADYCLGSGSLLGIRNGDTTATVFATGVASEPVASFGEDEAGELYVITDSVFGGAGRVLKVARAGGACDITCPGDVSAVDADGDGSEVVAFDVPTAPAECGAVTCEPASGASFAVGTTTVTCSTAAGGGSCSFDVTVAAEGGLAVTGVDPASAPRRTTVSVTISGSGFADGATVSFGKKIKVRSVTVDSPTQITAELKIKKAKRGPRDVTVTVSGDSATCAGCFTVE